MAKKILSKLISSFEESSSEHWDDGFVNLKEGLNKIFSFSKQIEFKSPVDVLNFLLSEIPNGNCEHKSLSADDDFEVILKWVQINKKGNKFYMVRGRFKSGDHAIGVFFADDSKVFAEKSDPKICYTCKDIPIGIKDLFKKEQIYVQSFN